MEFQEVVRRRRMIRRYRPDPIPEDAVERIVSAALRGPTAGFSQGIDVVVVKEPEERKRVVEALSDTTGTTDATDAPEPNKALLDAPVLLVITADETRYHARYNEPDKLALGGGKEIGWPVPYWFVDAGAAMMLALLAAVDEGLAAGFYGHPDHVVRLQTTLGLPSRAVPIGVIAIGYSSETPLSTEVRQRYRAARRPTSEAVHRERW